MKILVVGAGAHYATRDVENGYVAALRDLGADIKLYALEQRMQLSAQWLMMLWRRRGSLPEERPLSSDILYRAAIESLEMALRFAVDWVLIFTGSYIHNDILHLMRRAGLKTALLFTESPYEDTRQLAQSRLVDWAWTNERTSTRLLHAAYLQHAYDPAVHRVAEPDPEAPAHDVVFVGTGFEERCNVLEMCDWSDIDLALWGNWKLLAKRSPVRKKIVGKYLTNDITAEVYRKAKIGLNLFRSSAEFGRGPWHHVYAQSANPRTFELAANGVFQISQYRPEVEEIFGDSVPTFESPRDLERLVRRALSDASWRLDCAERARHLVAPHTFAARAAQVLADLERAGAQAVSKGA